MTLVISTTSQALANRFANGEISFEEAQLTVIEARADSAARTVAAQANGGAYNGTTIGGASTREASIAGIAAHLEGKGFPAAAALAQAAVIHDAFRGGNPTGAAPVQVARVDGNDIRVEVRPAAPAGPGPSATVVVPPPPPSALSRPSSADPIRRTPFVDAPVGGLPLAQVDFSEAATWASRQQPPQLVVEGRDGSVTLNVAALRDIGAQQASPAVLAKYGISSSDRSDLLAVLDGLRLSRYAGLGGPSGSPLTLPLQGAGVGPSDPVRVARLPTPAALDAEVARMVRTGVTPAAVQEFTARHGDEATRRLLLRALESSDFMAAATMDVFDPVTLNESPHTRTARNALYPGAAIIDHDGNGASAGDRVLRAEPGGGVSATQILTGAEALELRYRSNMVDFGTRVSELATRGMRFNEYPAHFEGNPQYWTTTTSKWFPARPDLGLREEWMDSDASPQSLGLRPGVSAHAAVMDVFWHPESYRLDCAAAQTMARLAALAQTMGPAAFDAMFARDAARPNSGITVTVSDKFGANAGPTFERFRAVTATPQVGDTCYFDNAPAEGSYQGENTIMVSTSQFAGFPLKGLKSPEWIIDFLNTERRSQHVPNSAWLRSGGECLDFTALFAAIP